MVSNKTSRLVTASGALLALLFGFAPGAVVGEALSPPTVRDAIEMLRVQGHTSSGGSLGAFSPDGERFAFVTWQGDLAGNVNIYRLMVARLNPTQTAFQSLRSVFVRPYAGDPVDQHATAIEQVTFLEDDVTVAFITLDAGGIRQVFAANSKTGAVKQLTYHASDVKEFVADAQRGVRFYSAVTVSEDEHERSARLDGDGVFPADRKLFSPIAVLQAGSLLGMEPRRARQYFFLHQGAPIVAYDSRQSRASTLMRSSVEEDRAFDVQVFDESTLRKFASLISAPAGKRALMYPYSPITPFSATTPPAWSGDGGLDRAWATKLVQPYALVDIEQQRFQQLKDVRFAFMTSANGGAPPVWRPDGGSVVVFAVSTEAGGSPRWIEVDTQSGQSQPLNLPTGWKVLGWGRAQSSLVVAKDNQVGTLQRRASGEWGKLRDLGVFSHLNWRWTPAANGQILVGLFEGPTSAPELVALDLETGKQSRLTDFNPQLRERRFARIEELEWSSKNDAQASGFLVYPQNYQPSRRYPLVILLDDGNLKRIQQPFLLDASMQLNGHAIQMIAAQDMMVLYPREPASKFMDADECERMREHIESAVAEMEKRKLVDPDRIGLSGWSRAGFHTDCLLIHGHHHFAAATRMDGGGMDYKPRLRQFLDSELQRIQTPLLVETHGLFSLVQQTAMLDRMEQFGRPTEVLHFPNAPHSTLRPQHRLRSLETHIDWWRFWLKDEEDPALEKADQYARWRRQREQQVAVMKQPRPSLPERPS